MERVGRRGSDRGLPRSCGARPHGGIGDLAARAAEVLVMRSYHPSMFEAFPDLYEEPSPRRGVLDLPFRIESATGVQLPAAR